MSRYDLNVCWKLHCGETDTPPELERVSAHPRKIWPLGTLLYAKIHRVMPCPVAEEIKEIISCDRKMIQTYIRIYVVVGLLVIATIVYLRSQPAVDKIATSLITLLVGSIAIPVVFLHLKRKNALTPCTVKLVRALKYPQEDPECSKLKDWIDEELKRRNGES